jgi:histidinol-phosphatase (PHP family)
MERSCARAVELGLPAIAFTEHLDHTTLTTQLPGPDSDGVTSPDTATRRHSPPVLDVFGYLEALEVCRQQFLGLRIISGLEIGEPHWHAETVARLLKLGRFDRLLGSQHCLQLGDEYLQAPIIYRYQRAADVVRQYLAEVARLIAESQVFAVLAHIDFAVRFWPAHAGPFDPRLFEDEFRHALRLLADTDRILEVNTRLTPFPELVRWWREEGGSTVSFGSDAHEPTGVARGFNEAVAMVEAHGFRPGRDPYDFWTH